MAEQVSIGLSDAVDRDSRLSEGLEIRDDLVKGVRGAYTLAFCK